MLQGHTRYAPDGQGYRESLGWVMNTSSRNSAFVPPGSPDPRKKRPEHNEVNPRIHGGRTEAASTPGGPLPGERASDTTKRSKPVGRDDLSNDRTRERATESPPDEPL